MKKFIENFFGNLDWEIRKTGAQGFEKCSTDLVTKYSRDLVNGQHKWRIKAKSCSRLEIKERSIWQKLRIVNGKKYWWRRCCKASNKQQSDQACFSLLKSSWWTFYGVEQLNNLVEKWKGSEKSLHIFVNSI